MELRIGLSWQQAEPFTSIAINDGEIVIQVVSAADKLVQCLFCFVRVFYYLIRRFKRISDVCNLLIIMNTFSTLISHIFLK